MMEQLIFQESPRKRLSKEETRKLFIEYNKTKDIKIKEEIIRANLGLIPMTITHYFSSAPEHTFDELVSEGLSALSRAVDLYNVEEGIAFSSYAVKSIWGTIIRYLKRIGKYEEVASLDELVQSELGDEGTPLVDLISGETEFEEKLVDKINRQEKMKTIYLFLETLPNRDKSIVMRYWGLNGRKETVREIANDYGVAFSRVHEIIKKQTKRMRVFLLKKGGLSASEKKQLRSAIADKNNDKENFS